MNQSLFANSDYSYFNRAAKIAHKIQNRSIKSGLKNLEFIKANNSDPDFVLKMVY